MQRGSGAGGGRATLEGPLPTVGGILAATQESGSPSSCFPGRLILIYPWSACQFSSGKSKSWRLEEGVPLSPPPPPFEDVPFLCYSVRNLGYGKNFWPSGDDGETLGWGHI